MANTAIRSSAVQELISEISGDVVLPGEAAYEDARAVYNAMREGWPALIVRALDAQDVAGAIGFARAHGLMLAVRGGNHSIAGFGVCDDGLVLDLAGMRRVDVDVERRVARVQGGCTWADVNDAAYSHGLATTGGLISTTGVAGLTLGGGIGFLCRSHGFACDNLVAAELVTADAEHVRCSEDENADLLWGLRGGGGNFGVVTTFELRLHPVGEVLAGPIFFPLDRDVLRGYREFVPRADERLSAVLGLTVAPPAPFLPAQWHGKPVAVAVVCWTGEIEEGVEQLRPLESWGPELGRSVASMPYPAANTFFDTLLPRGLRHYWKSCFAGDLSDDAVDVHIEQARDVPNIESGIFFYPVDGACHRVPATASAFPYRDATFAIGVHGSWHDRSEDDRNIAWVRRCYEAVRPFASPGEYVNFMSSDGQSGVAQSYGRNYRRLVELKRRHDPHNVFCLNQNIDPER